MNADRYAYMYFSIVITVYLPTFHLIIKFGLPLRDRLSQNPLFHSHTQKAANKGLKITQGGGQIARLLPL